MDGMDGMELSPLSLIDSAQLRRSVGWEHWSPRWSSLLYLVVAARARQPAWAACMTTLALGSLLHHTDAASESYAALDHAAMLWSLALMSADLLGVSPGRPWPLAGALASVPAYRRLFAPAAAGLAAASLATDWARHLRYVLLFAVALAFWYANASGRSGPHAHSVWHALTALMYDRWIHDYHGGGRERREP